MQALSIEGGHRSWRLISASSLMLFVELGLIRWTGAYNIYLSFFTNLVLLASFLGIGLGFIRGRAGRRPFTAAALELAALSVFLWVFPVSGGRVDGLLQVVGGFGLSALPRWLSLSIVFGLTVTIMASIGAGVADVFRRFDPLPAYRLDIGGSVIGIVAMSAMASLELPPVVWAAAVTGGFVALGVRRAAQVGLALFSVVVAVLSLAPDTIWSPYQRSR